MTPARPARPFAALALAALAPAVPARQQEPQARVQQAQAQQVRERQAQTPGRETVDEASARGWIYYDWIEDGELRGGRLLADPANPMHAAPAGPSFPVGGAAATTLIDNGPPSNRVDLVFVGDGYTAGELGEYAQDVDDILPAFFAEPPFDVYLPLVNAHRVDVVSPESGVDNDPVQGVQKDTAMDMEYWCGGTERLLCVNVAKAIGFASSAPDVDQVLAVANSSKYGGAGYSGSDLATLAGENFSSIEIALHELGHSMGDLADEYTYGGPANYEGGEPQAANLSKLTAGAMAAQETKWHLWLDVPAVGAFEGGGYSQFGVYRPTVNSKMRNLGRPFEEVNTEQLVVAIYLDVDPIDDAAPAGLYTQDQTLWVDPVDPAGSPLAVSWSVDGALLPGETGTELDLGALGLADGAYQVVATVTDETPLVRDQALRAEHMTSTREWTAAIGDDPPPFVAEVGPKWAADTSSIFLAGGFLDEVTGARIDGVPAAIQIQAFDELALKPGAPSAPGFVDLELDTAAGTTALPGAVPRYPTLVADATGPGGELTATLTISDFENGACALLWGLGLYPAPLPVGGVHHGWSLDLAQPYAVLASGPVAGGSRTDVLPIPENPALAGLEIHLQAWGQKGALWIAEESFTAAIPVTL